MAEIQFFECIYCNKKFIQQKKICPDCKNGEFEKKTIPGTGKVYTHTTIHVSSGEFTQLVPYTVVLVEFDNGLRVTGRVTEQVHINDRVECVSYEGNQFNFSKI